MGLKLSPLPEPEHGKLLADDVVVEHVPAEVCERCGQKTYSPAVTDELFKFAKDKFKPVKKVEVPVYDFAETC